MENKGQIADNQAQQQHNSQTHMNKTTKDTMKQNLSGTGAPSTNTGNSAGSINSILGSLINIISKSEIRYEGVLIHVDLTSRTMTLQNVRAHGSEGRRGGVEEIPPSPEEYGTVKFKVDDIKDLKMISQPQFNDPAIVSTTGPINQTESKGNATGQQAKKKEENELVNEVMNSKKDESKRSESDKSKTHQQSLHYNKPSEKKSEYPYERQDKQFASNRNEENFYQNDNNYATKQQYPRQDNKGNKNYESQGFKSNYVQGGGRGKGLENGGYYKQNNYKGNDRSQPYHQGAYPQQNYNNGSKRPRQSAPYHPVGELGQNPNKTLKEQFKEDFDFELMRSKLDLNEENKKEEKQKNKADEVNENAKTEEEPKYNKEKSFFDSISSSTVEKKMESATERETQRKKDAEAFGLSLSNNSGRGGRGGYGNRYGGNQGYNNGGYGGRGNFRRGGQSGYNRGGPSAYGSGRGSGSQGMWTNYPGEQNQNYSFEPQHQYQIKTNKNE